ERVHVLKLMDSFPAAKSIVTIETQYGDFVAEKELAGGCLDENRSARSKSTRRETGKSVHSGTVQSNGTGSHRGKAHEGEGGYETAEAEVGDDDDDDGNSVVEEVQVRNAKIVLKPQLDADNAAFARLLLDRALKPPTDMVGLNRSAVAELSKTVELLHQANGPPKSGRNKVVDTSFLQPGEPVHIYSGQALNTAELQKRYLRAQMEKEGGQNLYTYSAEYNSGIFPMLDKEVPLDRMLRQEVKQEDGRDPFRYPRPREIKDYIKLENNVTESRKEELESPWVENELRPDLDQKEIVRGAFDAQSLGTGGAHVIPVRRNVLFEPNKGSKGKVEEVKPEPMKFQGRASTGLENVADKYHRTLLDGEPNCLGISFEERRVPKHLVKKYGKSKLEIGNIKAPPVSYNLQEAYIEDKGSSMYLTDYMKSISRPLVTHGPGGTPSEGGKGEATALERTQKRNSLTVRETASTPHSWREALNSVQSKRTQQASPASFDATAPPKARKSPEFNRQASFDVTAPKVPNTARGRPGSSMRRQAQPLSAR
ncbi:unnamed protein product, partial [Polarella glacialis]